MIFHVTVLVCAIWIHLISACGLGQGCEWIQVAPCASRSKSDRRPSRIKPSFQGVQSKKRLLQEILCLEPLTGMRHAKTNLHSHFEKENFKSRFGTSCIHPSSLHTTDRLEPCAMLSGLAPVPKHFLRKLFEQKHPTPTLTNWIQLNARSFGELLSSKHCHKIRKLYPTQQATW